MSKAFDHNRYGSIFCYSVNSFVTVYIPILDEISYGLTELIAALTLEHGGWEQAEGLITAGAHSRVECLVPARRAPGQGTRRSQRRDSRRRSRRERRASQAAR